MKTETLHDQKIHRLYFLEHIGTLVLYVLVQAISLMFGPSLPPGLARTLVLLSPIVPVVLMIGTVVRHFRRVDEYQRLKMLENLAITAGVTFGWTFLYGLLEIVGFPRIAMWTICPTMALVFALVSKLREVTAR